MDSNPPTPSGPGQRSLAAIVFTDVVSFSARMQADEENTLKLLQRDFDAMREICKQHHGSVLKTTGDGLLLYFSSAVQAVACALAMQRHFAEEARNRPATESLVHRLGIHLGDVFVNQQDVMGDGVNIAARLQAEAEPGGICISQTVYDVVKNKLALSVTKLGPRELKNISQAIPIYRLLLEAQAMGSTEAEPPAEEPAAKPAGARWKPSPLHLRVAIALAAVAVIVAGVLAWRSHAQTKHDEAQEVATQAAINAQLSEATEGGPNRERVNRVLTDWREELREKRSRAADEYNYGELERSVLDPKSTVAGKPDAQIREQELQRMQSLFVWMATDLQHYSKEKPLVATELTGTAPKEINVFVGADRRPYIVEGGAIRQRIWSDLKPSVLGAIIVEALLEAQPLPPRHTLLGAQGFAMFFGLPELTEALRTGHARHPGR